MHNPIRKVALCSATGKIGPFLLDALLKEGFDVTVVSRISSTASFLPEQKVIEVSDEYPDNEIVDAFRGQDAVVLALSFELLSDSTKFAKASLEAGCRWLIASTYGANLNDKRHAQFPASIPHRQAVDDLANLQNKQDYWSWTSISCGPWVELAIAAGAWDIDGKNKKARLVDGGHNVFSSSTRAQVALAAARVLKLQPQNARNTSIFVSSFEASMTEWVDAHKYVLGDNDWAVTEISGADLLKKSREDFSAGNFHSGYMGTALVVCTGAGYDNRFSKIATLANAELGLPEESMVDVVRQGLALPNPFA